MSKKANTKGLIPIKKGEQLAEKPFDKVLFESLCEIQCTEKEIMRVMKYESHNTLIAKCRAEYGKTFEEIYEELSADGKRSLRRSQFDVALSGNATLLIWLGKQWLNQKDAKDIDLNARVNMNEFVVPDGKDDFDKTVSEILGNDIKA